MDNPHGGPADRTVAPPYAKITEYQDWLKDQKDKATQESIEYRKKGGFDEPQTPKK